MGATNCPETPRQKMITMMYLVYTAMLALNVSAQVVDGFKTVGSAMTESNKNLQVKLDDTYANFDLALQNSKDKVQADYDKAQEVRRLSKELGNYIDSLEYTFMAMVSSTAEIHPDKDNPKKSYKMPVVNPDKTPNFDSIQKAIDLAGFRWLKMDELHNSTNMFIKDGKGKEMKEKVIAYKKRIKEILGEDSVNVKLALDVEHQVPDPDNVYRDWESVCFEEVVSGSALVTLTRMKAETMNAEFDAVNTLYKHVSKGDFKFDKIAMISRPKSTYIIQGGTYETDINVAAYDSRQHFTATINGQQLTSGDSGSVHYRTVCGNLGMQKVTGVAYVTNPDGGTQEYPINDAYFVAKPVAVVSLDNMQVLYSGIANPITVSVPGIDGRNVKATIIEGNGKLDKVEGDGKYMLTPANNCKKIVVGVDAVMDKGAAKRMGAPVFKVRPIPDPQITVAGSTSGAKVARSQLTSGAQVVASRGQGFEFQIPRGSIRVISLEVSVGNKPFNVNGDSFDSNPELISAIKRANRGDKIFVDAKVSMPDGIPRVSSCVLTITK